MNFGPGDLLKNVSGGISDDGNFLGLQFTTTSGAKSVIALGETEIAKILAFIVEQASKSAAIKTPSGAPWQKVTANPIPVTEIGVAPGRTGTEAFLCVRAGICQMTFSTELATLLDALRNLEAMTVKRETSPKPN